MIYRTEAPLLVLAYDDNHDAAVTVPAGRRIEVVGPSADDRFLVVRVGEQRFIMFETDLCDLSPLPKSARNEGHMQMELAALGC